jgi:TetR/AcrR family transcriptional regulator, tetracycline repressor protein
VVTRTGTVARTRERLTRERVIDAAIEVMDAEGLDAVTMRRVAREVGVEAMSLYNHVRDKDDLLDGMRFKLFLDFPLPDLEGVDPFEGARLVAHAWRALMTAHPHLIELMAESDGLPSTVEAYRPMEFGLAAIRRMGVPQDEVVQVFHAFGGYIQGFAMMERQMGFDKTGGEQGLRELSDRIDPSEFPCLLAAIPFMMDCDVDEQFELGLDLMLNGLRVRYGANADPVA